MSQHHDNTPVSMPSNDKYREEWDRIFGRKKTNKYEKSKKNAELNAIPKKEKPAKKE